MNAHRGSVRHPRLPPFTSHLLLPQGTFAATGRKLLAICAREIWAYQSYWITLTSKSRSRAFILTEQCRDQAPARQDRSSTERGRVLPHHLN